ncbi:exonuclease 3'-5' domain containing 1 [Seminavis robusta]|uniref:Exonuclease 3'-5' domain containing 1 n=1 Tax=Seminavis robusta TaxID=568900 RepID=A0A9N8DQZ4_9STRA|nr:exonuclease 3'-5' domain containing 1 [Seminavis robusta]|eukprot:Sro225_g091790.1 exonuclease 3'-5' domain containing 1 (292) ;mRNA; f:37050-37925
MTRTLIVDNEAQRLNSNAASAFFAAVERACRSVVPTRVAFDCEGVSLSRIGSLEVVSLCFEDDSGTAFLVDLNVSKHGATPEHNARVAALKQLFECPTVTKIIHDCRMDCDALYHHCGISLQNVHDTSCYHTVITLEDAASLNTVLAYNGVSSNTTRDSTVYQRNPNFWAMRPMTAMMITWASSDVDKLLQLASRQTAILTARGLLYEANAKSMSARFAGLLPRMSVDTSLRCRPSVIGKFMGTKGRNVRNLEKRSGACIYRSRGHVNMQFIVYYPDQNALSMVRRAMAGV